MAHKSFTDEVGVVWMVWDVVPTSAERRRGARRTGGAAERGGQAAPGGAERRRAPERRQMQTEPRARVALGLEKGWLVFESPLERRRLAPIPEGWESSPPDELRALRDRAMPLPRRPRLLE